MATKFNLRNFLTANRGIVISKYEILQKEKNFSGISLRDFMLEVMRGMEMNNPRSDKRAADVLSLVVDRLYVENCKVLAIDRDEERKIALYGKDSAYMAII